MFPVFPKFCELTDEDKDKYNFYYFLQDEPNSDYCFSVARTWLAYNGPVEVSQVDEGLIVLRYTDILRDESSIKLHALIGKHQMLTEMQVNKILCELDNNSQLILSESQLIKIRPAINSHYKITEDLGLNDYIYSVKEYTELTLPEYRRIRREISIFEREYLGVTYDIVPIDLSSEFNKKLVINTHHSWDDTYKYANDPDRVEGEILAKIVTHSDSIGVKGALGIINGKIEGIFIYSELRLKSGSYVNLHHARFSYRYRHLNDVLWVEFAKYVNSIGIDFINFERDVNIEGLRLHKQLLKPKRISKMYIVETNKELSGIKSHK